MKKSIALLLAFILVFCGNVLVLADTTQEQVWDTGAGHSITIEIPRSDPGGSVKDSRIRGTSEKGAKIQPRKTEEIRSKGQSIGNG